jgi:hypothetical protein
MSMRHRILATGLLAVVIAVHRRLQEARRRPERRPGSRSRSTTRTSSRHERRLRVRRLRARRRDAQEPDDRAAGRERDDQRPRGAHRHRLLRPLRPGSRSVVHPGGVGGLALTFHADGSFTLLSHGTDGMITMPGVGVIYSSSGMERIELSATGDVVFVEHGNKNEDHTALCPYLAA